MNGYLIKTINQKIYPSTGKNGKFCLIAKNIRNYEL